MNAWRRWDKELGILPVEVHVAAGERLIDRPYGVPDDSDDPVVRIVAENPRLAPLLRLNVDRIVESLQPYDPLSWHCRIRQAQHQWFMQHQRNCQAAPVANSAPPRTGALARDTSGATPSSRTVPIGTGPCVAPVSQVTSCAPSQCTVASPDYFCGDPRGRGCAKTCPFWRLPSLLTTIHHLIVPAYTGEPNVGCK